MKVLDLFAGTGWGVACQQLGWDEEGVEKMPEAQASRAAYGLKTIADDVRDITLKPGDYDVVIASPPCQTFSMAGNGAGRKALDIIFTILTTASVTGKLIGFDRIVEASGDERTALVLEPLRIVLEGMPTYVFWEQVPTVLPVWEACADILRDRGYSVVTGNLQAEQYGVPQTRKRALLIARRDGIEAFMPKPTHSKFHNRQPTKLDPGVKPWVSMAEALGWSDSPMVGFPRKADHQESITINGQEYRARDLRDATLPSQAVTEKARSWEVFLQSRRDSAKRIATEGERRNRSAEEPAVTITGEGHRWSWVLKNGNQANASVRSQDQPAPTMAFGHAANNCRWIRDDTNANVSKDLQRMMKETETLEFAVMENDVVSLRNGNQARAAKRPLKQPSGTLFFGQRLNAVEWLDSDDVPSRKLSLEEAAVLQSFPPDFPFQGSMSKRYLQVGNAVPPLLALAVLRTITDGH